MANKKRLVWTDDVMAFLCKRCNEMYSDEPCEPSDCLMLEELDKCPTVEVVRGEWVVIEGDMLWTRTVMFQCSACGVSQTSLFGRSNYCPNCGADMRERKDNAGTPRNRLD